MTPTAEIERMVRAVLAELDRVAASGAGRRRLAKPQAGRKAAFARRRPKANCASTPG